MAGLPVRLIGGLVGAAVVGKVVESALTSERGAGLLKRAGFGDLTSKSGAKLAAKYGRAAFAVLFGALAVVEEADAESEALGAVSAWPNRAHRAAALLFVLASLAETIAAFVSERHERLMDGRRVA